ncbi:mercuric ion transporter MerT [Pseudomonas aeruginosa]|nr:mercuric ion transporter MerT [Pseudomonas aeruginosa]
MTLPGGSGARIGYARVSTPEQDISLQIDALERAGCSRIFQDVASGAKAERKGLDEALAYLRPGDTLVVWKIDRLGRSLAHLVAVVEDLRSRGIGFRSLTDPGMDTTTASGALFTGGLAAILASACCLGPLVLIALGFSGAWIGNLAVLEPYRPIFIGVALVALFFAWRRIYRQAAACKPGEVCAIPQVRATYKLIFWIVAALVLVALGFPYVMPFFY